MNSQKRMKLGTLRNGMKDEYLINLHGIIFG